MVHDDEQLPPTAVMGRMLDGFLLSQALFVLAEAGVATILDQEGPQTVAVLAERTGEPAAQKYFGKTYFDYVATNPELAELFGRAMTVFADTLRAGLFDGYRLPAGDSIADLGGGDGAVLVDLLGRDDHLDRRGVVSTCRASSTPRTRRCPPPVWPSGSRWSPETSSKAYLARTPTC